jgi:competence protein ComFC
MSLYELISGVVEGIGSLLYPPHCALCGADLNYGEYLCPGCRGQALRIKPPFCQTCSQPFDGEITAEFSCANCSHRRVHFDCAAVRYRSRGIVRELLHRFKYQNEFYLRHPLSEWLQENLDDSRLRYPPIDALVPVPLHAVRQREREFNQAEALATMLASKSSLRVQNCLVRIVNTTSQTRLDRTERMENLHNAFRLRKNQQVYSMHLVLVDDVFTTGSTVDECARVLKKAGAASVRAITVARG